MTLTASEVELITRYIGKLKKLQNDLSSIVYIPPVLTPTKESEIVSLITQIKANEIHIDRGSYVAIVQPLKDQLRVLVQQNKQTIADNNLLTQQSRNGYNSSVAVVQDKINSLNDTMKSYLDILGVKLD